MAYYGKYSEGANGDWVDLVAEDATLSGNVVLIQNRGDSDQIFVVFDGTKPTDNEAGFELGQNEVIWGSGTSIWVRGGNGFTVAVMDKE